LSEPIIGMIADRSSPRLADGIALTIGLGSFPILWFAGHRLAGLIAGIVMLDLAMQANLVSNQTHLYGLLPEARSRLNTIPQVGGLHHRYERLAA
jgi:hypothetical protein